MISSMWRISICILMVCLSVLLIRSTVVEGFETMNGIRDAWYINLDRSPERRERMEIELEKLPIQSHRWKAVDGLLLTDADYTKLNIPNWSRPNYTKETKEHTRKGEIGVFLSHKTLLEYLHNQDYNENDNHLILEDDVFIQPETVNVWNKTIIDNEWDIIFMGLPNKVEKVSNGIGVPKWITGAHAYVVKHSSLPKILHSLRVLYDPIDEVYARNVDGLVIYALSKPMISQTYKDPSTIVRA